MNKFVSDLSLALGLATRMRPQSGFGKLLLWIPKLLGSAFSPILAIAGVFGILRGIRQRKFGTALCGLFGTLLNTAHILKVTQESTSLALAFGAGYEKHISPEILPRLKTSRWSLSTQPDPEVHWKRDMIIASHPPTGEPLLADLWLPPKEITPPGTGIIYLHGSG